MRRSAAQVNVAFSLHSPIGEQRNEQVPANRQFPLEEVLRVLDEPILLTGRRVWLAYLLLEGRRRSKLDLIPSSWWAPVTTSVG